MDNFEMSDAFDLRFERGSTHLVVGPSASGKTFRTCDILKNKDSMIRDGESIRNVIFCYSVWQPIYSEMQRAGVVAKFVNKKPTCQEFTDMVKPFADKGGSIVVIDDFMGQIDSDLVDIVTVHSRHNNVVTFILFQSLFPPNKLARQISLNVKYIHLHKNPRENSQVQTLARQLSPKNYKWIVQAYHHVTQTPHSAFLFDLTQGREENLRYRSHYLPKELPMRAYMAK